MGGLNLKSLHTRIISAAVMIPAVLAVLYFGGGVFVALLVVLAVVSLYEWIALALKCRPVVREIYALSGVPYVIGSFACCYLLFNELGPWVAAWFLLMVWGSDIGAFFFGKFIGGPKMAVTISPNKTWAGFIGGVLTSGLIGVIGYTVWHFKDLEFAFLPLMFILGGVVAMAGQAGDLVVSAMKRKAGAKDTGAIIPGHGGLLDRIDSMLLAAPVFVFFTVYM